MRSRSSACRGIPPLLPCVVRIVAAPRRLLATRPGRRCSYSGTRVPERVSGSENAGARRSRVASRRWELYVTRPLSVNAGRWRMAGDGWPWLIAMQVRYMASPLNARPRSACPRGFLRVENHIDWEVAYSRPRGVYCREEVPGERWRMKGERSGVRVRRRDRSSRLINARDQSRE